MAQGRGSSLQVGHLDLVAQSVQLRTSEGRRSLLSCMALHNCRTSGCHWAETSLARLLVIRFFFPSRNGPCEMKLVCRTL